MKRIKNSGFSLLEMIIAMSIIAIVIAFSLALMGDGMRRVVKANELLTATALAQYEVDRVKNIAFPPTTIDKLADRDEYAKKKGNISYNANFQVEVKDFLYDRNGSYIVTCDDPAVPPTQAQYDDTMIRKITVDIYRKKDDAKIVTLTTYISRNGVI